MSPQIYKIIWQGIEIEARYEPQKFGGVIAHLELVSISPPRARLPMTETGYRSHFHRVGTIEKSYGGDVVACVVDWLDKEAKSKHWQDYIENARQFSLF